MPQSRLYFVTQPKLSCSLLLQLRNEWSGWMAGCASTVEQMLMPTIMLYDHRQVSCFGVLPTMMVWNDERTILVAMCVL